jgi:hypothetical protein
METVAAPAQIDTRTPTMLLEVFAPLGHSQWQRRFVGAGATCTVGRALTCDIVLDDDHAAAEHTLLTLQDDGRVAVKDLGSRNGTRVDGERIEGDASQTIEDGLLIVGRTRIRVRTLHAPLAPEVVFRRDALQRHRTALALGGLALTLGFLAFNEWRTATDQSSRDIFVAILIAIGLIGVWVSAWGLLTRIGHGVWKLRMHAAIVTVAAGVALWCSWLLDAAQFALQWRWPAALAGVITVAAVLAALYLHLRKATHLSRRVATIVAMSVPLLLGGAALWIGEQDSARDVNRIARGTTVFPPQIRVAGSMELDEFLRDANSLKREASRKRQASLADQPIAAPDR